MHAQEMNPQRGAAAVMAVAVQGILIYGLSVGLGVVPKPAIFSPPGVVLYDPAPKTPPTIPPEEMRFTDGGFKFPAPNAPVIDYDKPGDPPRRNEDPDTGGVPFVPTVEPQFVQAQILKSFDTPYPNISRLRGEEGMVYVRVRVSADGRVEDVQIERSSGFARLDDAALKAVRGWRFGAATRGGHGVGTSVVVPVKFELRS